MSANLTVKDISENKKDSADSESSLVKEYESLYFGFYLRAFIFRICFFIYLITFTLVQIYSYKNPFVWSILEPFAWIFSTLVPMIFISVFSVGYANLPNFLTHSTNKQVNKLEDKIVKKKLIERFGTDISSQRKAEDFYIELNGLTKAKYETAFRFYRYEFYIYTILSLLIAGIFTLRML